MSYMHDDAVHYDPFAADAAADARAGFIRRTYLHLFGAIIAFMALETIFLTVEPITATMLTLVAGNWWIALIAFMGVSWLAHYWASSGASPAVQYAGLGLYTVAEALIFVPLLYFAHAMDQSIIPTAGFLTMLIFGGLTVTVFVTGADFSFLKGFLTIASLLMLGVVVASFFISGLSLGLWFSAAMIGLMSGYILYETSNIQHHYRTDQHVAASLALFSSVATLFFYVVRLLMSFSED